MRPPNDAQALPGTAASATDAALRPLLAEAGAALRRHFRQVVAEQKADGTQVSIADREAEAILVSGLRAAFPDDAIRGEEGGGADSEGANTWFIDPLDGTAAFLEGLPTFCTVLGRVNAAGETTCGALYLPRVDEYFFFGQGVGAFRDGLRLPPLGPGRVHRDAILNIPSRLHAYARLDWPGKCRCLGSTALHLALVATGAAAGALVGPGWMPWDTAAAFGLIRATGGVIRQLDGSPLDLRADVGAPFIAGSAATVAWLAGTDRLHGR